MAKVCAAKKSKTNPLVYTILELKKIALKKGFEQKDLSNRNKKELCRLLGINWEGKTSILPPKMIENKPEIDKCSGRVSKNNPFTKKELIDIAFEKLGKNLSSSTKEKICEELHKKGINMEILKIDRKIRKSPKKSTRGKNISKRKLSPARTKTRKIKSSEKESFEEESFPMRTKEVKSLKKKLFEEKQVKTTGDCVERNENKLLRHQKVLVEYLRKNRGVIAAFEMGTGKTRTAIAASECFLDENPTGLVVVVTPKSLQMNFRKEMELFGTDVNDKRYKFYTINKFSTHYSSHKIPKNSFLIIDEAHNLRTKYSKLEDADESQNIKRSEVAVKFSKIAKKVMLLTGTPLYNGLNDVVNLIAMVKGEDPISIHKLESMTAGELCDYFRNTIMFFDNTRTSDYPIVREHVIREVMNKEFYKQYRDVENSKSYLWKDSNPFKFLTVVRQATSALEPCQKCTWAINKIKEGQKTVVYSSFLTYGVKKLQRMLDKEEIKYVEVTGKMTEQKRNEAVKLFNQDKIKVLFITKAGSEGLNLKGGKVLIILERSWNRQTELQIIRRLARYKSHSHLPEDERFVDVYHLMIIKPALKDFGDHKLSADEMLENITNDKQVEISTYEKLMRSVAIDKNEKCPPENFDELLLSLKPKPKKKDFHKAIVKDERSFKRITLKGFETLKARLLYLDKKSNPEFKLVTNIPTITFQGKSVARIKTLAKEISGFNYGIKKSIQPEYDVTTDTYAFVLQ